VTLRTEHADIVMRRRRDAIAEIVAAICHEVNNPLAAAVMGVELVIKRAGFPEESALDLETVRDSLDRIDEVLQALTDVRDRTVTYHGDSRMIDIKPERAS